MEGTSVLMAVTNTSVLAETVATWKVVGLSVPVDSASRHHRSVMEMCTATTHPTRPSRTAVSDLSNTGFRIC